MRAAMRDRDRPSSLDGRLRGSKNGSSNSLEILQLPIDEVLCPAVLIYARKSRSCTNVHERARTRFLSLKGATREDAE
jgi:hypothetical protein